MELLTWMREHLGASARPAAASARTPKPDAPETLKPDAPKVPRAAVPDLITAAAARFPGAASGGTNPSLGAIQGEMKVGQGKVQQIQRHFLSLRAG